MREFVRPVAAALSIACLAAAVAIVSSDGALAQQPKQQAPAKQAAPPPAKQAAPPPAQEAPLKQVALTEKQIQGVLSAAKEMDPLTEKLPDSGNPDAKLAAQLDGVAKKNGFASYDEYNNVVDNITIVLGGFDAASKKYVGNEAVIKAEIAAVQADKKMPAKEKKEVLDDLTEALKTPGPAIENKGNIDLVTKYYDKLAEALGEGDQ